jgi:hypothetical protein
MKTLPCVRVAGSFLIPLLLAGCATTQVTNEWRDPEAIQAGPYKTIFVGAAAEQDATRRQVEDAFQAALAAEGVTGIPSYNSLPKTEKAGKEKLSKAVKEAGADAVLLLRKVKAENKVAVSPGYYGPPGFYSGYSALWVGYYDPIDVYQYDIITLEARLYDVATERLVWAVSTETTDPRSISKEITGYAGLISKRLAPAGFVAAP